MSRVTMLASLLTLTVLLTLTTHSTALSPLHRIKHAIDSALAPLTAPTSYITATPTEAPVTAFLQTSSSKKTSNSQGVMQAGMSAEVLAAAAETDAMYRASAAKPKEPEQAKIDAKGNTYITVKAPKYPDINDQINAFFRNPFVITILVLIALALVSTCVWCCCKKHVITAADWIGTTGYYTGKALVTPLQIIYGGFKWVCYPIKQGVLGVYDRIHRCFNPAYTTVTGLSY